MKVLFIFPNFDCPVGISIGISYLSASLKKAGHETKVLHISEFVDYPFNKEVILKDIVNYNPGLIAISVGENHYDDMVELIKFLRAEKVDIPIAMGGIHVTLNAELVSSEYIGLNYLVLGEGEDALVELVNAIECNMNTKNIPNVWAISKSELIRNNMRPLKDITVLPHMDLDIWEFEKITLARRGWVNISMNRGCPYRCSFCHNVGEVNVLKNHFNTSGTSNQEIGYLRLRGVEDMISELKEIAEKYKYLTEFSFIDDTLTFNKDHMKKFFELYAREVKVPFVCLTTINDLDEELISIMKKANCDMIRFGVESATEHIRKNIINRNFSNEKLYKVFDLCKKYNIRTFAFNIIAHPNETREEILDTLKLNAEIMPEAVRVSLGYPYKGTKYYEIAKKLDVIDEDVSYHNYSTYSKFKFSNDDKLWIDKVRNYFKWWLNMYLNNECSNKYQELINYIEKLSDEEWENEEIRNYIISLDEKTTKGLQEKGVIHYTSPYPERPDIVVLYDNKFLVKEEELDEH